MVSVLDRKLRRDLSASKGLLAAIIAIIAVGISCFVSMASVYFNLENSRRSYYAQCRMADFWIPVKKAPLSELAPLARIPGVVELRPRIAFEVTVDIENVEKPLSGRVLSLPDRPAPIINSVILKQGGYFTERRREEVIVNDAFAKQRRIKPGDRIRLILNNRLQELFVVGTAIGSEFVYLLAPGGLVPDPDNYGVFYVKQSFAEEVFDFQGACNEIVGLLAPEKRDHPDEILRDMETRLEPYGVVTSTPRRLQPSHWFLSSEIRGLKVSVLVLPAIFLAVAALILNVLMLRLAEQQRTIVGTLKALGYSNRQVFWHYLKFGTTIGVIGGVLGAAAGFVLAGMMTEVYKEFFEFPNLINRPYPDILLLGVAISVACAVAGALRGVRTVVRLAPAEAMRPKPPARGRKLFIERWRRLWLRLDFRWHMVLRGFFRHRLRSVAGIVAATVGSSILLMTFYFRDAMIELIAFQFDKVLVSDFDLSFKDDRPFDVVYEASHLPGVDYVEPVFTVPCTFRHGHHRKQGAVTGLMPGARLTSPRDLAGHKVPVPSHGLLLTRELAKILDAAPGDTLTMVPMKGLREPREMPVARIVDSYLGLAAYADFYDLNRSVGEEAAVSSLQLKVQPGRELTRRFYHELKRVPTIQGVGAVREQKAKMVEVLVDKMLVSIFVITGFAGLIFFGSILNASLISLSERQQEIATFRVLGYTPREVGIIFLRESLCLNLLGTLLGLPLGYWWSVQFMKMYGTELFRLPLVVRPSSWGLTIVLGLAFALLAHIPVQRAINRMDWLRVLNVKE